MEDDKDSPTPEELEERLERFLQYAGQLMTKSVVLPPAKGVRYPCPCCGCRTLTARGFYDICSVCFWEDDGQDEQDADTVRGGPNALLSLTQARTNYKTFGASEGRFLKNVRPPLPEEMPRE